MKIMKWDTKEFHLHYAGIKCKAHFVLMIYAKLAFRLKLKMFTSQYYESFRNLLNKYVYFYLYCEMRLLTWSTAVMLYYIQQSLQFFQKGASLGIMGR